MLEPTWTQPCTAGRYLFFITLWRSKTVETTASLSSVSSMRRSAGEREGTQTLDCERVKISQEWQHVAQTTKSHLIQFMSSMAEITEFHHVDLRSYLKRGLLPLAIIHWPIIQFMLMLFASLIVAHQSGRGLPHEKLRWGRICRINEHMTNSTCCISTWVRPTRVQV